MKSVAKGMACLTVAMLILSGCAMQPSVAPSEQTEQIAAAPVTAYVPTVEESRPVSNYEAAAVNTCNREPGAGVIMSFDDYGTPEQVHDLLDVLDELNWRAYFFPIGEWSLDNWSLVQDIQKAGHVVGNHTMTHPDLLELLGTDESEFYGEIYPLKDFATTTPMLLRPPFGSGLYDPLMAELLADRDIQLCGWTADTNDWRGGTAEEMLDRVMNGYEFSPEPLAEDGVVLAHIHGEHTIDFVRLLAEELDARGWHREPLA